MAILRGAMRMKSFVATAIAVFAVAGASCRAPSEPTSSIESQPGGPFTISGTVTDFATGVGVSGAHLTFGTSPLITDETGTYTLRIDRGDYQVSIDGESGVSHVQVRGPWTRGDLLAGAGACTGRYGEVTDSRTGLPIAGAVVKLRSTTTTAADGWYRADVGCFVSFNTTFLTVTAPGYANFEKSVGLGVQHFDRLDLQLDPLQ
jgi:hypothetical protein